MPCQAFGLSACFLTAKVHLRVLVPYDTLTLGDKMSDILHLDLHERTLTMECIVPLEADVLAAFPAEVQIPARLVAASVAASSEATPRVLVVLDDDPTGTQSVADLPVLTRWEVADFAWAFAYEVNGQRQRAVYVLTNTRSLGPAEAASRNEEIVRNALAAAAAADPAL